MNARQNQGHEFQDSISADLLSPVPGVSRGSTLLAEIKPYVRHCGAGTRGPWHLDERLLLDYLLVYIEAGRGLFSIGKHETEVVAGDLFWVPPNTLHSMQGYPPTMMCPYLHFDLNYRPGISHWDFSIPGGMTDLAELMPLMHTAPPDELASVKGRLQLTCAALVGERIHHICDLAQRATPFGQLQMSAALLDIITLILDEVNFPKPAPVDAHRAQLEKAAAYIRAHCATPLLTNDLAALVSMSPCSFRQLFTLNFGRSPHAYLVDCRIRKAKDLMFHTELLLSEIASQAGFSSIQDFSRCFRRHEGLPPRTFRAFSREVPVRVEGRRPVSAE